MIKAAQNWKVLTSISVFLLLVIGGILIVVPLLTSNQPKQVTLTYWGFWDPEVIKPLIDEYQSTHPNVTVNYERKVPENYRETLQTRIASGTGPDIFRFQNSWLPMLRGQLSTVPSSIYSPAKMEETFYPIVKGDLKTGGAYYGIPLEFDGLALVYNQDMFNAKGYKSPPSTWDQLRNFAATLTVKDEKGNILVGGAALGTENNVEYFSDIIGLMMLQNGVEMIKDGQVGFDQSFSKDEAKRNLGVDALSFYVNFTKVDKVWSESLPSSIEAFAEGKAAMIFIPSDRLFDVLYLSRQKGINLKLGVAPVPQLEENSPQKVAWGRYLAEGVSRASKNQSDAWSFVKFLSENESLRKLYTLEKDKLGVGEPYSRIDMASLLANDLLQGAYINQAYSAKNWYLNSQTFDGGLNDLLVGSFVKVVDVALRGDNASSALSTAAKEVAVALANYGLVNSY
ncbi:MAG: extracellular solute-binding protein [Patescibacteria group bacterium]|nr:extracellular solute-binding protein [Patescibacteria group bacterium]